MKIKKMFVLVLLSIFSLLTLSNGYAQEFLNQEEMNEPLFEKVYVSSERILICSEGLFYLNEKGNVIPVHVISSDASGLYVLLGNAFQCPSCERWNRNNICNNPRCPMFGR